MALILIFTFAVSCSSCTGALRRKFVRKKSVEVKEEPVLHPQEYGKEFTNQQLYANHFAFWRAAESEFISCLTADKNGRRLRTYTAYAVTELEKLHDLLIEDKQKQLRSFIDELKEIASKIDQPNYVNSHRNLLAGASSKHYRTVSKKFSYYSMREYIRPEEEGVGAAPGREATPLATEKVGEPEQSEAGPVEPEKSGHPKSE